MRFKGVFSVLFTIPMLIPSISHGMGLVLLLGDNGLLTNLLGIHVPLSVSYTHLDVYKRQHCAGEKG